MSMISCSLGGAIAPIAPPFRTPMFLLLYIRVIFISLLLLILEKFVFNIVESLRPLVNQLHSLIAYSVPFQAQIVPNQ